MCPVLCVVRGDASLRPLLLPPCNTVCTASTCMVIGKSKLGISFCQAAPTPGCYESAAAGPPQVHMAYHAVCAKRMHQTVPRLNILIC